MCGTLNGRRVSDGSLLYGCTCNMSISAAAVSIALDTSFPAAAFEDVEFCVRARKAGISVSYAEDAVIRHCYEGDLHGLFGRFRKYGLFEAQVCIKGSQFLHVLCSCTVHVRIDY